MKKCTKCGVEKSTTEFRKRAKSKDGLEPQCKDCRRAHDALTYKSSEDRRNSIKSSNRQYKIETMTKVREILASGCVDCGLNDVDLLEFDHVRGTKVAGVGVLVARRRPWKEIQEEIGKCQVRCLHCHRKKTIRENGWYASLV